MTRSYTLDEVATYAHELEDATRRSEALRRSRDVIMGRCYASGTVTLGDLARASGLSVQRVHQIVGEGDPYPRRNAAGVLVWACCESSIGPACEHMGRDEDR